MLGNRLRCLDTFRVFTLLFNTLEFGVYLVFQLHPNVFTITLELLAKQKGRAPFEKWIIRGKIKTKQRERGCSPTVNSCSLIRKGHEGL